MEKDLSEMTDEEAEEHVLSVVKAHGRMTTRDLERAVKRTGKRCPDGAVRFLMRLKTKGRIQGEVVVDKGGWVWWMND